jgi:hypothetical protein
LREIQEWMAIHQAMAVPTSSADRAVCPELQTTGCAAVNPLSVSCGSTIAAAARATAGDKQVV